MSIFQNIQDYFLKYTADKKTGCRLPDFRFCNSPLKVYENIFHRRHAQFAANMAANINYLVLPVYASESLVSMLAAKNFSEALFQ